MQLAKLLKEDRADARKRKVEVERLQGKYRNRPAAKGPPPSPQIGQDKK